MKLIQAGGQTDQNLWQALVLISNMQSSLLLTRDLYFVSPSSLAQGMGDGIDSLQSQRSLCHSVYHVTQLCPRGLTKRTAVSQVALVVKNPPANAGDMRHRFNL